MDDFYLDTKWEAGCDLPIEVVGLDFRHTTDDFYLKNHIVNIIRFELANEFDTQPERFTEIANSIYSKIIKEYEIRRKQG